MACTKPSLSKCIIDHIISRCTVACTIRNKQKNSKYCYYMMVYTSVHRTKELRILLRKFSDFLISMRTLSLYIISWSQKKKNNMVHANIANVHTHIGHNHQQIFILRACVGPVTGSILMLQYIFIYLS